MSAAAATVDLGRVVRTRSGTLRLPVHVSGLEEFTGLEVGLHYEPATLRVVSATLVHVSGRALVAVHSPEAGSTRIAAAGAEALNPGGRATVIVTFEATGHARSLRGVRVEVHVER